MSPYLSRLAPEDLVEGRRRTLYSTIFDSPGISFTTLRDQTNIRFGVLQYHLETLERSGIVESVKVGRYRRYYPIGLDHHEALRVRAHAADPGYLRTLVDVETLPGSSNQELHNLHPSVTRQSVSYRLRRLEKAGAIRSEEQGRYRRYVLTPEGERALEHERISSKVAGHCPDEPPEDNRAHGRNGDAAGFAPLVSPATEAARFATLEAVSEAST